MKHLRNLVILGALLLAAAGFLLAPTDVKIRMTPKTGFPPLKVSGYVTIEPNPDNRLACIIIDSPNYITDSCRQLDGADYPKSTFVQFTLPQPGEYHLQVVLYRTTKTIVSNVETIILLGDASTPEDPHGDTRIEARYPR